MRIGVVIPAAGQGKRMKTAVNKQYLTLIGRPVLVHTIELFSANPEIDQIIVVVREDERKYCQNEIINKYFKIPIKLVAGGETRRQSVFNGLKAFSPAIDYVIIHDGARPLLPGNLLDSFIGSLGRYKALTMGVNVKDTIKRINNNKLVVETLDRNSLISIQTPQGFNYNLIMEAHRRVSEDKKVTDDSSLVELIGYQVKVFKGSYENIKITTPFDLALAELILKNRGN